MKVVDINKEAALEAFDVIKKMCIYHTSSLNSCDYGDRDMDLCDMDWCPILDMFTGDEGDLRLGKNKYDLKTIIKYIENHGDECPECESEEIDVEEDFQEYYIRDGAKIERAVKCDECGASWTEVFILTAIVG
jgi:hypothetical protein